MNLGALFQQIAGKNSKMLGLMTEALSVAQGIQQTRQGLLEYINKNNAKIRDMLPYLQQGTTVRSILDSTFPGMAPKIETFGKELMKEQESGLQQQTTSSTAAPRSEQSTLRNRFPALKPKR